MRYVGLLLIALLTAVAVALPEPAVSDPGVESPVEEPPVAVCAIEEGSGRTTEISVTSTVNGEVSLTLFASGETAGSITHRTGASGSIILPVVDIAAVGTVGGLIEMPIAASAAGALVIGSETTSAEACAAFPEQLTFLAGATTAVDDEFELHLMNPYAGEAIADLTVQSEAGLESNERFDSVIVPPRSSRIIDFTELVPGRETLSITIETRRGRVISVGRQSASGDSAVWRAAVPAQDWYIPIPAGAGARDVVIATPNNAEVEYQVDFYGPSGLEEALLTGVLEPLGKSVVDVTEMTTEATAVRVVSTGPVVATLWQESSEGLAVTNGSPEGSNRWFLPSAGSIEDGWQTVVILNTALDSTQVTLRPLTASTSTRSFIIESDSVLELAIDDADGYLIESIGEAVVMWSGHRADSSTAAIGVPISNG